MTLVWETNISKYSTKVKGRFYTLLKPIVKHIGYKLRSAGICQVEQLEQ
jgi:hypothetical protein